MNYSILNFLKYRYHAAKRCIMILSALLEMRILLGNQKTFFGLQQNYKRLVAKMKFGCKTIFPGKFVFQKFQKKLSFC